MKLVLPLSSAPSVVSQRMWRVTVGAAIITLVKYGTFQSPPRFRYVDEGYMSISATNVKEAIKFLTLLLLREARRYCPRPAANRDFR